MEFPPNATVYGLTVDQVGQLIQDHEELGKKYDQMRESFSTLSVEHFQLKLDYKRMSDNVKSLNSDKTILQRDLEDIMKNFGEYKRGAEKRFQEYERGINDLNAVIGRYQATAEVSKEAKLNSNKLFEIRKEVSESIMDIRETLLALEESVS
jgi:predicted nuclease with TOPRIM domain